MNITYKEYSIYHGNYTPTRIWSFGKAPPSRSLQRMYPNITEAYVGHLYTHPSQYQVKRDSTGSVWLICYGEGLYAFECGNMVETNFASKEDAAEAFYHRFYREMTSGKFAEASAVKAGREIVLEGTAVTLEEYQAMSQWEKRRLNVQVIPDACDDSRHDRIWVLNWPTGEKEGFLVKPVRVRPADIAVIRADLTLLRHGVIEVQLPSGKILHDPRQYRVWCPERYVRDEVYCFQCKSVFPSVSTFSMKSVKGIGPCCGPCRDRLVEQGQISESSWDHGE